MQSVISNDDRILLDLPLCFQSFTISYFELGYFEFPAISNSSFFPYTLSQPRYFELVKNRVRTYEHSWKPLAFYLSSCCVRVIND